jgi:hypothetical protein
MRKLLASILTIAAIALPAHIAQAKECATLSVGGSTELINDTDLTSAASFAIAGKSYIDWDEMVVFVELVDADASITKLQMTCTGTRSGSATTYDLTSGDVSAGELASTAAKWSHGDGVTGGGTADWMWRVNVKLVKGFACTFTALSGTPDVPTDTLKVYASACFSD